MSTGDHPGSNGPLATNGARLVVRRPQRDRRDRASREQLVERILAEFQEMPCLRLTAPQARRLFGLRSDVSDRIIDKLVKDGPLRLDSDGRYAATEKR